MASESSNLQKMFASDEWNESHWARKPDGKATKNKVNDPRFWKKPAEIVKIAEPLVKVLRLVDGEKLAMGYIYEAMDQEKEQIRAAYKDSVQVWAYLGHH
jgi:hypothetical protein